MTMLYIFTYLNGRRAIQGEHELSLEDAKRLSAKLSKDKRRNIVLKSARYVYETERSRYHSNLSGMDMPVGTVYDPILEYREGKIVRRY